MSQAQASLDRGDANAALALFQQVTNAGNVATADLAQAHFGRGEALGMLSRPEEAVDAYTAALSLDPNHTEAYLSRGAAHRSLDRYAQAVQDYDLAVQSAPNRAGAQNDLAWILATCPDSRCLDGDRAVQAAEKAVALSNGDEVAFLDTLAAAYAEAKRFDEAVAIQERVVDTLRAARSSWLPQAQERLELYRGFKPYRDRD